VYDSSGSSGASGRVGVYGSNHSTSSGMASSPRRSLATPPPIPTDAIPYIIAGTPDLLSYEDPLMYPMYDTHSPFDNYDDRGGGSDNGGGFGGDSTDRSESCGHDPRSMLFSDSHGDGHGNVSSGNKEDLLVVCPPHANTNLSGLHSMGGSLSGSGHSGSGHSGSGSSNNSPMGGKKPPSFHDAVKRSTRFITSVLAGEVLETVESILEQCRLHKTLSPIGVIGRVEVYWESYRLDVWGADASVTSPPLCSLHLYQLPNTHSTPGSPARLYASSPSSSSSGIGLGLGGSSGIGINNGNGGNSGNGNNFNLPLYLVEFVRGQLEIFAFKRFYEWIRHRMSELVKRDYAFNLFDQSGSPM
jgi:hypothetical protein